MAAAAPKRTDAVDVVVVGSGMGALCTAIACDAMGLSVRVLEKDRWFGGATARSGAALWLPGSRQALAAGLPDDRADALAYLDGLVGTLAPQAIRQAFVETAPEALAFFEAHSALELDLRQVSPDYHPERPFSSKTKGRVLDVRTFDGRRLGPHLADLRPAIETHLLFGFMAINRADLQTLLAAHRSARGLWRAASMVAGSAIRRMRHGRDARLVLGAALVGRLAYTLFRRGVGIGLRQEVTALLRGQGGRIEGVAVRSSEGDYRVKARLGVVLATGGFSAHPRLSSENRARAPGAQHVSMFPASCTGDGLAMAEAAGAVLAQPGQHAFFWSPVSLHKRPDGSSRRFAHLTTDRAKPGIIAIDRSGKRFTNEADSYHRFGEALQNRPGDPERGNVAWLICDATALRRYGLGIAKPYPAHLPNRRLIADGYLLKADSIAELASRLGIAAGDLSATLDAYNRDAEAGEDRAFGKGNSAHNRPLGDAAVKPNPCLAPVSTPPFYAVALHGGDLGTARGLRTDTEARVLDAGGDAIQGLYAVGNDMNSLAGGTYPGPGITLGPALVFAYRAARHIAAAARGMEQAA